MVRGLVRNALYRSGLLSLIHGKRNREALTVVLFHRVLPSELIDRYGADLDWTVTEEFFRDCLRFFKRHYNIVSQQQVQDKIDYDKALPPFPLLITFDDGWKDNLVYALPIAEEFGVRPLLFVTTSAIGQAMLSWQETLYSAWRIGRLQRDHLDAIAGVIGRPVSDVVSEDDVRDLIRQLQDSSDAIKSELIRVTSSIPSENQMLNPDELKQLMQGFDLGTHGFRHEPLTQSDNPQGEMTEARNSLQALTGLPLAKAMSFPHGRGNSDLVNMAYEAGYCTVYSGERCHVILRQQKCAVIGRHNMSQLTYQDARGRLKPDLLALYLFRQPVRAV